MAGALCGRSVVPNYHVLPAEAVILWHASRPCLTPAGAATIIIFVCRDKTRLLSRQNYACRDKIIFVATNMFLSRQNICGYCNKLSKKNCHNKHIIEATKFCRDKHTCVATNILVSRQTRVLVILVAAPANDTLEATHTFQAGMVSFQHMFPVKDRTRAVGPSCHLIHFSFAWTQICAKNEVGWGKGLGSLVFTVLVVYDTLVWQ